MGATQTIESQRSSAEDDQVVVFHDVGWKTYLMLLKTRGDKSVPRLTYSDGVLQVMSPGIEHERDGTMLARLIEAWSVETGIDLNGFGRWTLKHALAQRGLEPDECYVLDDGKEPKIPDIALEVVRTSGGIAKLDIYLTLGVPEVWFWQHSRHEIFVLRRGRYQRSNKSRLLPTLDLALMSSFVGEKHQSAAIRRYRAALHARG